MNNSRDREDSRCETSKCTQHKAYSKPKYTCYLMIHAIDRTVVESLKSLCVTEILKQPFVFPII